MNLPTEKFKTIVIDPPWPVTAFNNVDMPYPTMPITAIAALPIRQLTEKDCNVFLWVTNSTIEEGFGLLRLWGLRYKTTITWCKNYGVGRPPYSATEHILMASCGQPPRPHKKLKLPNQTVWIKEEDRMFNWIKTNEKPKHSTKPEEAYKLIESCSVGPYFEMFARKPRPKWVVWGNEV